MLIVGAKGFAKEVLEVLYQESPPAQVAFYDDVSEDLPLMLNDQFPVLKTEAEARQWLRRDRRFALGVGVPKIRQLLADRLRQLGGELTTVRSPRATIGLFDNTIGPGCSIMTGAVLTGCITLDEGVLVNLNCTIGHDCHIGAYTELSPGVHLSGHVVLGARCSLGTGAVVLPGVRVGPNCVIGAGSVVTKDVEANTLVVGVPHRVIKCLV